MTHLSHAPDHVTIPSVAAVLFRKEGSDEVMSALSIDTAIMGGAPVSESVGIDVHAFDQVALTPLALFDLFCSLKPQFPSLRHLTGVVPERKVRWVILFSDPGEPNNMGRHEISPSPESRYLSVERAGPAVMAGPDRDGGAP